MSYNRCPPFPCTVPPIRTGVFGSGRLFQPAPLALQAPGYAYLGGDQNPMSPLVTSPPCGPADVPPGCVPAAPPTSQTTVVGAGILSPVRWRGNGVFADNYALPGDIAREPDEGWWASETIDADTGTRSWITSMSGLGALGAASGWLNRPLLNVGGVTIPRWIGLGALVAGLWWLNKKKGWIKNRGRSRRRNGLDSAKIKAAVNQVNVLIRRVPGEKHMSTAEAAQWAASDYRLNDGETEILLRVVGVTPEQFHRVHSQVVPKRRNGTRRRNGYRSYGGSDEAAARELELFIDNDSQLYHGYTTALHKSLANHVARGTYSHAAAVKGFMGLAEAGAKKYAKEFASPGEWHQIFTVPTRKMVAERFAKEFETENALGNYKHLLAKKYQKNRRRSRRSRRSGR